MRSPIVATALALFVWVVACGGKVADGQPLGVASCSVGDPRSSSCDTVGDECGTTLTSCDGTSAASTCYCTGQHLWSCDVPETACTCMPGGTCASTQPTCSTRIQADCGWFYDVTCTCDDSTHTYTCDVPSCPETPDAGSD